MRPAPNISYGHCTKLLRLILLDIFALFLMLRNLYNYDTIKIIIVSERKVNAFFQF